MSLFYKKTAGLALCTLFSATSLYAQQSISGIVSDANGPISGATVSVKGTSRGTQTGGNGSFTIQASTGETLRISMVGYKSQEVVVGSNKTINVSLTSDQSNLEEVVVTAMGIKKAPRELGYAMSTIDSKELTKTGSPNFAGALYGKAPGVRITTAPGGATSGVNINIRGINSITGGSQPLVIIDGVPMRQNKFDNSNYWGDQRARGNGLEDLNPEDIETVSILKGASAAALYGSEAMNGVVLITTKSNKGGTGFSIDFNANYTHDQIAYLPKFQNVRGPGYSLAYANGGQAEDKFFYYGADRAVDGVTRGVLPEIGRAHV